MMYKRGEGLTNVVSIVVFLFIMGIFIVGIKLYGAELQSNPNAELSTKSQTYIINLNNISTIYLNTNVEEPITNGTTGNLYDFALEFMFGVKKANVIKDILYTITHMPSIIMYKMLGLDRTNWSWIVDILGWLLFIFVFIAIVYFIRNR